MNILLVLVCELLSFRHSPEDAAAAAPAEAAPHPLPPGRVVENARYLVRMRKLSQVPCALTLAPEATATAVRRTGNTKRRYPLHAQLTREEARKNQCYVCRLHEDNSLSWRPSHQVRTRKMPTSIGTCSCSEGAAMKQLCERLPS